MKKKNNKLNTCLKVLQTRLATPPYTNLDFAAIIHGGLHMIPIIRGFQTNGNEAEMSVFTWTAWNCRAFSKVSLVRENPEQKSRDLQVQRATPAPVQAPPGFADSGRDAHERANDVVFPFCSDP